MSNQSKTEAMPPTGGHSDPDAAEGRTVAPGVDHAAMRAGAASGHTPGRHRDPAALAGGREGPDDTGAAESPGDPHGVPANALQAAPGSSETHRVAQGVAAPPTGVQ